MTVIKDGHASHSWSLGCLWLDLFIHPTLCSFPHTLPSPFLLKFSAEAQ